MDRVEKASAVVEGLFAVTHTLSDFPFVADLPKREKSARAKLLDAMDEVARVTAERGPLIPQSLAAEFLGLSSQRVSTLITTGRVEAVDVHGRRFVVMNSFREFAKIERRNGRPRKSPALPAQAA